MNRLTKRKREGEDEKTRWLACLTRHNGGRAVLLGIAVLRADGANVGLRLVGTQPLPLLLQPVLVLQVVLHVGLWGDKRSRFQLVSALECLVIQLILLLFSGIHFFL